MSLRSVAHQLLDSPFDGNLYGRENGAWVTVPSSSGGMAEAPTDGQLYGRRGSTASWLPVMAVASGVPASPAANQLWWNSTDGNMYLWFNDGTSTQWVPAVATAAAAGGPYLGLGGGTMTGAIVLPDGSNALSQTVGDGRYLRQTGGAVTGATTFSGPTTLTAPLIWTATGSSTQRAAQDRSAEIIDVKDFGAKGDGATDDTATVQAAFNAAAAGGEVYFPPGTYVLSGTITQTFTGNASVCGAGAGVSILSCATNGLALTFGTYMTVTVYGLSFVSTVAPATNTALAITSTDQSTIAHLSNLNVRGNTTNTTAFQTGISLTNVGTPMISDIFIRMANGTGVAGPTGIYYTGSTNNYATGFRMVNSLIQGGHYGVQIGNWVQGVYLVGTDVIGNDYGVYWAPSAGSNEWLSVTNCHFNCGNSGVYTNGVAWISVLNSLFLHFGALSGGWRCIDIETGHNVAVVGNQIWGNNAPNEWGIMLNNSSAQPATVTGNAIGNVSQIAINLNGNTANASVVGNSITSSGNGVIDGTGNASNQIVANSYNGHPDIDFQNNVLNSFGGLAVSSAAGLLSGSNWATQGGYIGWNYAGNGMTNFINSRGASTGGFSFYNTDSNVNATPTLLMSLQPTAVTISSNLFQTSGGVFLQSVNQGLILGATTGGAAGTPYLDFHSSGNSTQDVRLLASGGSGATDGNLTITGSLLQLQTTNGMRITGPLNYTATGGSVARAAQDRAGGFLTVEDFGAVGDGATDDSAAFNAYAAYVRASTAYEPQATIMLSANRSYLVRSPINFNQLHNWPSVIEGNGSTIIGNVGPTQTIISAMACYITFKDLKIISQGQVLSGVQIGLRSTAGTDDLPCCMQNVYITGQFTNAPLCNRGAEDSNFINCTFSNQTTGGYALIMDGGAHWAIDQTTITDTFPPNNPLSFNGQTFIGCRFYSSGAANSPGIWMGGQMGRHNYITSYVQVTSASPVAVIYGMFSSVMTGLSFDVHCENLPSCIFFITGTNATAILEDVVWQDHYNQVQTNGHVFVLDSPITSCVLRNLTYTAPVHYQSGVTLFDQPAKYTVSGQIEAPSGAFNNPAAFNGHLLVGDVMTSHVAPLYLRGDTAIAVQYDSGTNGIQFWIGGNSAEILGGGGLSVFGTKVVGTQIAGWGTPTGGARTANFNGASATLAQTSAVVAQLILDLKTHGLLGT